MSEWIFYDGKKASREPTAHNEDNNLASVNYCHSGKKLCIAVAACKDYECFVATAKDPKLFSFKNDSTASQI